MKIIIFLFTAFLFLPTQAQENPLGLEEVRKKPKSLFLIKKKIDERDFGEPTLKSYDHQMNIITQDQRLENPFSDKKL